jgi:hypothetical protein
MAARHRRSTIRKSPAGEGGACIQDGTRLTAASDEGEHGAQPALTYRPLPSCGKPSSGNSGGRNHGKHGASGRVRLHRRGHF